MTLVGWMVYAVAVSVLLALAAWSADRGMGRAGLPTRWLWMGALVLSLGIPAFALLTHAPSPSQSGIGAAGPAAPWEGRLAAGTAGASGASWGPLGLVDGAGERLSALLAGAERRLPEGGAVERWIAVGWAAGSLGLTALFLISAARIGRRRSRWPLRRMRGREVRLSPDFGPAVSGFLRSEIVLPSRVIGLPGEELELILRHEEEHLRRRDPLLLLGALLPLLLLPWNPALWWQFRRLRDAVELDCDRRVLAGGVGAARYGSLLVRLGSCGRGAYLAAPALAGSPTLLERRLAAMRRRGRRLGAPLALLGGIVAAGLLAVACQAEAPSEEGGEEASVEEVRLDDASIVLPTGAGGAAPIGGPPEAEPAPTPEPEPEPEPAPRAPEISFPGGVPAPSERNAISVAEAAQGAAGANARDAPVFTPYDVQPQVRNRAEIQRALEREYPSLLRDAGIGGTVIVHIYIAENGVVGNALVAESSGHPQLDAAALNVARDFSFTPALNRDLPTAVWVQIPINFQSR